MAIFHSSGIDELKSIPQDPQRNLFELALDVEESNCYRKERKKLSSFLELRRGRHDTTNCITTVAGKITPPSLYSLASCLARSLFCIS